MSGRETPAGYSRILHRHVKTAHAELKAMGYPPDTIYALLMDVMMRLAYEEMGEGGVEALMVQVRKEGINA